MAPAVMPRGVAIGPPTAIVRADFGPPQMRL
jgi:hypothetical protein